MTATLTPNPDYRSTSTDISHESNCNQTAGTPRQFGYVEFRQFDYLRFKDTLERKVARCREQSKVSEALKKLGITPVAKACSSISDAMESGPFYFFGV